MLFAIAKRATAVASVVVGLSLAMVGPAFAVDPAEVLTDPRQEQRARALSAELRCLVCQNQSIDDSNAPLAKDLRRLVRERIVAGDDDRQVISFLVDRYGEFVLLRPPFGFHTLLLWGTPLLVLGATVWMLRRRRADDPLPEATPPLTDDERRQLEALGATAAHKRDPA